MASLEEIADVQKNCEELIENSKVITCISSLVLQPLFRSFSKNTNYIFIFQVRVDLKYTDFKQITICLRFPENYPNNNILVELKSKTLSSKLLHCLTTMCDIKAKENLGKSQASKFCCCDD